MKKYLLAGLLTWLPLAITVWVLLWVMGLMDGMFEALLSATQAVLPESAREGIEKLRELPGLGVLVMLGLLLGTGVFVTNIFGQWFVRQWDSVMGRIPIVKSIYNSVKQVSDTLFSSTGNAFREAVLVQYPHQGSWTIAFVTGRPSGEVAARLPGEHVSLYVPTTPNPTSGFFLMMPRSAVHPLGMSVDEALKYIISMGVVAPPAGAFVPPPVPQPVMAPAPAPQPPHTPSPAAQASPPARPVEADPNRVG
ncbi:MAG TPA: DUF502 domain-containing protein [Ideonella sp.]|nr:DUF502 domain-containing protein [Ideonella sp.]